MFDVGGIDNDKQEITVDATITYLAPVFHNGEQVNLQFTLRDSLTTNTIFVISVNCKNQTSDDALQGLHPLQSP
jgi:hypothetical protein